MRLSGIYLLVIRLTHTGRSNRYSDSVMISSAGGAMGCSDHRSVHSQLILPINTCFLRRHGTSAISYINNPKHAQTAIRSTKQLLLRCKLEDEDYQTALANMGDAPTESGPSAREILMGVHPQTTQPEEKKGEEHKDEEKTQTARHKPRRSGDRVLIKHHKTGRWNKESEVI